MNFTNRGAPKCAQQQGKSNWVRAHSAAAGRGALNVEVPRDIAIQQNARWLFFAPCQPKEPRNKLGELRLKGNWRGTLNTFVEPLPMKDLKHNKKVPTKPTSGARAASWARVWSFPAAAHPPASQLGGNGPVAGVSSGGVPRARLRRPIQTRP